MALRALVTSSLPLKPAHLKRGAHGRLSASRDAVQVGRGKSTTGADGSGGTAEKTVGLDIRQPTTSPSRNFEPAASASSLRPRPVTAESVQELLRELADPEKLGKRGEGWVVAQLVGIALVLFPPGGVRAVVDTLGGVVALVGITFLALGGLGLGQSLTPVPMPRDKHVLVTDGVYEWVRHPIYGGLLLLFLGLAVATGDEARVALTGLLFLVLDQKALYEERLLEERYGSQYEQYKQRTKKFIPWLY